jgi:hypothetical protein
VENIMNPFRIPTRTKYEGTIEEKYTVDNIDYEYPYIGKANDNQYYVWFRGGRLDIIDYTSFGLNPGNTIIINSTQWQVDSVIFVRGSKKGILTVI